MAATNRARACRRATSLSLVGALCTPAVALAVAHGDPAKGNNVQIVFTPTLSDATLTITGIVNSNETFAAWTSTSPLWTATVQLTLDETQDDEVYLTVTLQHTSQPDPVDSPTGQPYTSTFTVLAENYADTGVGTRKLTHPAARRLHRPHEDRVDLEEFVFTKSTSNLPLLDQDEIPNWAYTLHVAHVPEPGSLALLAAGVTLGGWTWRRRQDGQASA